MCKINEKAEGEHLKAGFKARFRRHGSFPETLGVIQTRFIAGGQCLVHETPWRKTEARRREDGKWLIDYVNTVCPARPDKIWVKRFSHFDPLLSPHPSIECVEEYEIEPGSTLTFSWHIWIGPDPEPESSREERTLAEWRAACLEKGMTDG